MTRIFVILALSCSALNVDALTLTREERSENTLDTASMSKMQTEAVKVIAEGIKRRVEDAAAGKLTSYNKVSHNDMHKILEDARKFLVDKRKQIRAHRASQRANRTKGHHLKAGNETCGAPCAVGIIIDGLSILSSLSEEWDCTFLIMILWWVQGIVTLMLDQGLSFDDAVFVLVQQVTSIGYGSHGPSTDGMKIWHALHSVVGVTMAAGPANTVIDKFIANMMKSLASKPSSNSLAKKLAANLPLALTIILTTFGYSFDLKATGEYTTYAEALLDSFYMTIISLTTVGYGDFNPTTTIGKLLSVPVMMYGTRVFALASASEDALNDATDEDVSLGDFPCKPV